MPSEQAPWLPLLLPLNMNVFLVFLGGGLGSLVRYGISLIVNELNPKFPFATLVSNVVACFLIGAITAAVTKGNLTDAQRLLLATGFCGGFSTFSTFSNETLQLAQNGQLLAALGNIILSITLCLAATFLALRIF
jgi:fluoride exporter